ncbi:hypothetical protein D5086_015688 [Populus alba]|uniref:Uncharacterized protein n=1 Tax=Populus alba TaxID=43335 RepID=A0ACC4BT32_POPAL
MASLGYPRGLKVCAALLAVFLARASGIDIFLEWNVALDYTIIPVTVEQPVITINGMFPGPLINATTNDFVHVNVFNNMDEPLLLTWNGIQQRLNSWQDGVSGTNCPIQPGKNWTSVFQTKDQIGSYFYFPSINFQKAAGGFGPIRVNNRNVIAVPFPKPEAEFDLLIGDWFYDSYNVSDRNLFMRTHDTSYIITPDVILMNGKGPYGHSLSKAYESFTVTQGYQMLGVHSVSTSGFKIIRWFLVETEGSYTNQITPDSLDVHVGQSYSVLVTADQNEADYYIVASPLLLNTSSPGGFDGVGVLHYSNSLTPVNGPLPGGPDPFDLDSSVNQARSIRWNMTTGAARPNPQGTFNVTNVTLSQTFILTGSRARDTNGFPYYTVNDVWWTAVYAYLDNPGMWNLRSQCLKNWYLGQQLYLRVYDADPNPAQEKPPPDNLLLCGITSL